MPSVLHRFPASRELDVILTEACSSGGGNFFHPGCIRVQTIPADADYKHARQPGVVEYASRRVNLKDGNTGRNSATYRAKSDMQEYAHRLAYVLRNGLDPTGMADWRIIDTIAYKVATRGHHAMTAKAGFA